MATAVVWAGVAASGWYWTQVGLAAERPLTVGSPSAMAVPETSRPQELARLLGAAAPVAASPGPSPADRFILSGVIASSAGQGAALISVDGKPARPFAVGSELAPGYVLISVAKREAMLADGQLAPVRAVLSMPSPRHEQPSATPPIVAPAAPVTSSIPATAPSGSTNVLGDKPPVAPAEPAAAPPVAARSDSRRQPQTSLRRDEQRTP
jgi:general secretion pathway protein C